MPSTSSLLPSTDFTFDGLPASPAPGGDFAALRHFRTYTPSDSTSPLGPGLLSVAGLLAALQPHTATLAGTQADKDSVAKPAVTSVRQREKADDQVGRAGTSSQAKRKGRAEPVDDEDESSQAAGRIPESEGGREELRNSSSDGGQVRIGAARWLLRHRGWTSRVCGFVPSPAQPGQYDRRPYNQGRNDQATAQRGRWVIETRPAAERAPLWNVCAQHWPQEVTGSTLGESYRLLVASQASSPSSLDSVRDRKRATSAADGVERPTKRPKPATQAGAASLSTTRSSRCRTDSSFAFLSRQNSECSRVRLSKNRRSDFHPSSSSTRTTAASIGCCDPTAIRSRSSCLSLPPFRATFSNRLRNTLSPSNLSTERLLTSPSHRKMCPSSHTTAISTSFTRRRWTSPSDGWPSSPSQSSLRWLERPTVFAPISSTRTG
ncbi:RHTO0S03e05578g3_1 [Rhodotorula toruloides]|uniref:RHTO0S03e05578g3_1 n=1 Tax=Rhodotorula toruloides TaxID=5286 RepID=A0A061ATY5_RHOTO|nr:RHTO0S03e05578g3_1 [Rhodotorula toruloides]